VIPPLCHLCYGPDPDCRNGDGEPAHRSCEESLHELAAETKREARAEHRAFDREDRRVSL